MKKFLNNPADIMEEMLEGMALANQKILYWEKGTHRIMRRSKKKPVKSKSSSETAEDMSQAPLDGLVTVCTIWQAWGMYSLPSLENNSMSPSVQ